MELTHITVGVLANPTPMGSVDQGMIRDRIKVFLGAMITAQRQMPGQPPITVLAGGHDHEISRIVYEVAATMDLDHRPGDQWGEENSQFFEPCSILVQLTPDEGRWCQQQTAAYLASPREHAVYVLA